MVEAWNKLMEIPEAKWIVTGTLLIFIVLVGIYVVTFFRNLAIGSAVEESNDLLSDFRQMRDEGQLDDEEFSKLKKAMPGNEAGGVAATENNGHSAVASEQPKKRFITLAEAQRLKQEQGQQSPVDESASGDHADEDE